MNRIVKLDDEKTYKAYKVNNGSLQLILEWYSIDFKATNPIDAAMEGYGNDHVIIHSPGIPNNHPDFVYATIINQIDEDAFYRLLRSYEFIVGSTERMDLPLEE